VQVKLSLEDEGQRAVVVHGKLQLEEQVGGALMFPFNIQHSLNIL
jgi:hypothetical protein